jgi:hypothetical protein
MLNYFSTSDKYIALRSVAQLQLRNYFYYFKKVRNILVIKLIKRLELKKINAMLLH